MESFKENSHVTTSYVSASPREREVSPNFRTSDLDRDEDVEAYFNAFEMHGQLWGTESYVVQTFDTGVEPRCGVRILSDPELGRTQELRHSTQSFISALQRRLKRKPGDYMHCVWEAL